MQDIELNKASQISKQKRKQLEAERSQKSNLLPQIVGRNNKLDQLPSLNHPDGRSEGLKKKEVAHRRNYIDTEAPYLGNTEQSRKELGPVPGYKAVDRNSKSRYSFNGLPLEKVAVRSDSKALIASDSDQNKTGITKQKFNKKTASNNINIDSIAKDIGRIDLDKDIRSPSCLTHAPLAGDRLIKNVRSQQQKYDKQESDTRFAFVDDNIDNL